MPEDSLTGNMSTPLEDSTAKSKKAAVKVGGGIGGIAVVGGAVAVGIAAVAISYLRQRHCNFKKSQHQNHGEETTENSSEICSESKPNEFCRGNKVNSAVPSSTNAEEIEASVEIIENFSDMDFTVNWMDTNKSKEEGSPRSHFSVGASCTSVGSDSEDLSEISQNNYRRDSEIDSSHMNLKEGNDNFASTEETAIKDFSHLRESIPGNGECITTVNQLMESKIDYEESVDSFDGLVEECKVVAGFVEWGESVEEQIGEKTLAVSEIWEENKSGQCDSDCKETYVMERGKVVHYGDSEHERVGLEEDGRSLCFEQFRLPFEGTDAEESEDSQRKDMPYKEILGIQVSESLKEDLCLEGEDGLQARADAEQDIPLVKEECLEDKISSSDGLNCEEEEYSQDVIDLKNSEDYKGGDAHCDEKGQLLELEESEENLCPIKEQSQQVTVLYEELKCPEIVHVNHEGHENDLFGANEEEHLRKQECLQEEKVETDVVQYLQDRTESEGEPKDCMVYEAHKGEHVQHKGHENEIDGANEEERLQKKQCLHEEKFETDVGQYLQERTESEEKQKDCMVDEAHKGEHVHHEGNENEIVASNEEEYLHKEHFLPDEKFETDVGQYLQETTESEEKQKDCMLDEAHKGVHVHHEGNEIEIVGANEEKSLHKEQFLQDEIFETGVGQYLQERTESEEQNDCMVDEAHKEEHIQHAGHENEIDGADKEECLWEEHCLQEKTESTDVGHYVQEKTESKEQKDCMVDEAHKGEHIHHEGHENEIDGANEEEHLQKEQCLHEEKFETKVGQYLQERTESEEEQKHCMVEEAHKGEHVHHEGNENEIIGANDEEYLHKEQILPDEKCETGVGQYLQGRTESENEQNDCMVDEAHKGEHIQHEGHENEIDGENKEECLWEEHCLHEEKFETDVGQYLQEKTESEEEQKDCVVDEAHKGEYVHHEGHENEIVSANKEEHLHKEQFLEDEKFETGVGQYLQERTESEEEQKDCMVHEVHKSNRVHHEGQENEIIVENEEECLCKEKCLQEEKFETDLGQNLRERTESEEEQKDRMVDEAHKDGHVDHEGNVNKKVGANEEEYLCKEKFIQEEKFEINAGQNLQERTELEEQKDCMVDEAHKGEHVHHEGYENEIVGANEEQCLHEEQCLLEEKFETDVEQYLQERTESEEQNDCMVDGVHKGEQCQNGTVYSRDSKNLDYEEGVSHCDEKDKHWESEDSEENFCPIKEHCQNETAQFKELECTEVDVHVHQDELKNEIVFAHEKVLLCKEKCRQDEKFECYAGQCLQQRTELEEFENGGADVAHAGEQCLFGTDDSGYLVGLDEGTSHENGAYQHGALDSKDFESVSHGNGSCLYGAVDLRGLEYSKDGVNFGKDQLEKEVVNSKEYVDADIGSEEKLLLQEENMKESPEGTEDLSKMNVQSEKNTIYLNEIEDVEGDALICKDQCQAELFDSKESQNSVQDAPLKNEGCNEIIGESEELELTDQDMPIIQEQCQRVTVNSIDIQDAVEDVPVKRKQCQMEISESEELDDATFAREEYQEIAVDLEELELSEDVHSSNELCKQDTVDPTEKNEPDQQDMVDPKEPEYPCGNNLILKELCLNGNDSPESSDNEDPKTSKPEEVDTKESECCSMDTLCFKKFQLEEVDKAVTEDCKQDPEKIDGAPVKESEQSDTFTYIVNNQKEVNQDKTINNVFQCCKLVGVSKGIQENDDTTDSVAKRVKNGWDPLHSSKLVSRSEEGKSFLMQTHRHLPSWIMIMVSLLALCGFLFLFGSKLAEVSTTRYAI